MTFNSEKRQRGQKTQNLITIRPKWAREWEEMTCLPGHSKLFHIITSEKEHL